MKTRISLLVLAMAAGTAAYAQVPQNPWAPASRADVLADLQEARGNGTIPSGEAMGYPYDGHALSLSAEGMAPPETHVLGGPPARHAGATHKGSLSRAQVLAELHEARRAGTIPSGEAISYPYLPRPMTVTAEAPAPVDTTLLGGPPAPGASHDGYRFIGGEAGFAPIGSRAFGR